MPIVNSPQGKINFQALQGSGNPSASVDKFRGRTGVYFHHRAFAQQTAKAQLFSGLLPMAGITLTAVVLELTMPMAASSAMIRK